MRKWLTSLAVALVLAWPAPADAAGPYAPYEFLIGEWNVGQDGAAPVLIARFRWGPNRSYITYAASILTPKGEVPHFEVVLMWNGVSKMLDMLIMLDLSERAAVIERGTLSIDQSGLAVREIEANYSEGAAPIGGTKAGPAGTTVRFRQTYLQIGPDRIATSALRESAKGWVPTFPGSDRLIMTRHQPSTR